MAIINVKYPLYFGTLQKEHGLSLTEIQDLQANNKVYVLELSKVEQFKQSNYTDAQIINYFNTQGYNAIQLQEVKDYLTNRNKIDSTGKTGKEKLDNTLATVQKISGTAIPILSDLAKIFGIGGNSLSGVNIPDLTQYTAKTADGYGTFTIDTEKKAIVSSDVSNPSLSLSSLPFGLTTESLILILVLLVAVYFFAKSANNPVSNFIKK